MKRRNARGANLIEAAITTLLLFSTLFTIFDLGRALNVYHALTDAAREGARYSVAPFLGTATLPTSAQVQTFTQNYLSAAGVTGATIAVNQSATATVNGSNVFFTQVTITAPHTFIFLPVTINLSTSAVMRNENN